MPPPLVARFEELLEKSVRAHAHLAGLPRPNENDAARELLDFENTRRMIGALLERCEGEQATRRAVAAFRSYQVAGLAALTRSLVAESQRAG